jgi:hypothetical protein
MNAARLTLRFEQDGNLLSAYCPELNLRNHGSTKEEASAQLMRSIWLFLRVCHDKGTLYQVLGARGALFEEGDSEQNIQIPLPPELFGQPRPTVR